jgi:hypothetical protein
MLRCLAQACTTSSVSFFLAKFWVLVFVNTTPVPIRKENIMQRIVRTVANGCRGVPGVVFCLSTIVGDN